MRLCVSALMLACVCAVPVVAEDVVFPPDGVIDVKVAVSEPNKVVPRTVVFPSTGIGDIPELFSREHLFVQQIRNTLIVHLKTAEFKGTLQVYDASGRLYLLNIIPATKTERIAEKLRIVLPKKPTAASSGAPVRHNIVEQSFAMYRHMIAYDMNGHIDNPLVQSAPAVVMRNGKLSHGRRIHEDDDVQILLTSVHEGYTLKGYSTVFVYRGTEPRRIDFQRLYFPGAISVYAGQEAFMDPHRPGMQVQPGQSIKVYYIGR